VAYNAASVLPRQLDALLRQTRPLQEIVVVDNGSTDGTGRLLAERYPEVKVLRLSENCGVGGGLATGLAYAAPGKRHDWVWTFDQDSVPSDDALEILLDGVASLGDLDGELGMVAPLPVHRETGTYYPPLLWDDGFVRPTAELLSQPIWFADLVISSGCMVRCDLVERIGLPRADFFLDFIDFEYCLRARRNGYKIAVVTGSQLAHEIGSARKVRFLGQLRVWSEHEPWREYYKSRNITYAAWWLHPSLRAKRFVIRYLARHACGLLLFGSNKPTCLKRLFQGFWDGRSATLGIRFRPDGPSPRSEEDRADAAENTEAREA
jgi:GT2 family glycosyltransferase